MNAGSALLGVSHGLLIGLLAVGIVLVYRSNRFLNVAHAQLGALSAQLLSKLVIDHGLSWWLAFLICVPVGAGVALVIDALVIRPMRAKGASPISLLLVTIGVTQLLLAFAVIPAFGANTVKLVARGYPVPFKANIHVGGVVLGGADVVVFVAVPLLVLGLAAFLQLTLTGKMIRAAASNPDAARLAGISTSRVSAITWGIAGGLSAVAAILQSPSQSTFTAATLGPELLLLALGAAAFGAFTSLPAALAGGVVIGLAQQLTLAATSNAGLSELAVFLVIIGIVIVRGPSIGKAFAVSGPVVQDRPPIRVPPVLRDRFVVRYQRTLIVAAAVAIGVLAPLLPILHSEGKRFQLVLVLIYVIVSLSLAVAIGWAGQVSLGQFAFVGAGAFVAAHLMGRGWSIPLLLIVCGLVGALLMVLVGLPALRVPGLTLAVTTLGLGVVAPDWLFSQKWFGTTRSFGIDINPPSLVRGVGRPGSEIVVYYLGLALVIGVSAVLYALRRSQPGRLVIAVRDNERKVATFGVTPATIKLGALSLSGFLAAAAGVLWADAWRTVAAGQFSAELSLSVLAAPVIGGIGSIAGAIVGALVIYLPTYFLSPYLKSVFGTYGQDVGVTLLFGGVGLILVLRAYPGGIVGVVQAWWQSRLDRMAAEPEQLLDRVPTGELRVTGVELAFGGIKALDGVSIEVHPGEIVGLIGPNGAGKTTLMNVISGVLHPDRGRVEISHTDVTGMAPELRSLFGLSRSFQDAQLFNGLTVTELLQVAMAGRNRVGMMSAAVTAPWVREAEMSSAAEARDTLARFGLEPWSATLTSELSTGTRRICDLAAQVSARPKLLLLDEPTGGVAQREAEAFGPLLRRIRSELDCTILIIEHDMPLLMGLCDRVYAMELGVVIAEGTPEDIRNDPAVIASYLGTDETAIARSGGPTPDAGDPDAGDPGAGDPGAGDPDAGDPDAGDPDGGGPDGGGPGGRSTGRGRQPRRRPVAHS